MKTAEAAAWRPSPSPSPCDIQAFVASVAPARSSLSCEAHRVDRRQRVRHACPAVALVLAHPKAARRGAEGEPLAGIVERQSVAIDDVVGVRLRQALRQNIEVFTAVAGARHDQLALAWDAFLVLDFRDE